MSHPARQGTQGHAWTVWPPGLSQDVRYPRGVRTVVLEPLPAEIEQLLARRRELGQDRHDEVWEGEYHMVPGPHPRHGVVDDEIGRALHPHALRRGLAQATTFNVGTTDNFRVPDRGLLREVPDAVYLPTAALVVEVLSPHDEAWEKLPHYAAHHVDEVVMVDPPTRTVTWLARRGDGYEPVERSEVLDVAVADVVEAVTWPVVGD